MRDPVPVALSAVCAVGAAAAALTVARQITQLRRVESDLATCGLVLADQVTVVRGIVADLVDTADVDHDAPGRHQRRINAGGDAADVG